jgi:hypothetical protein
VQGVDRQRLGGARVPVRLELAVVGPEGRELIALVDLVLAARRVVAQVRLERVGDRLVGIDDRVVRGRFDRGVVAERPEPPEPILHEGAAGVGVEVVQVAKRRVLDALGAQVVGDVIAGEAVPVAFTGDAP